MRNLNIFLFEWKHFIRSPFKVVAVLLFMVAGVYGLHNGANLYQTHKAEVEKIEQRISENRQEIIDEHFKTGNYTVENRPWINYSEPFWAIWFSSTYLFKKPSPAMVYSIGQSEQFGFYKRITFWASPYDADLAEEIANPERLQTGTLDFTFALLFLLPLVLLVLLYNIKNAETEQGSLPLIEVQYPSKYFWILSRVSFYSLLLFLVIAALLFYGTMLTPVMAQTGNAFSQMLVYSLIYLLFWSIVYAIVITRSKSILGTTLMMSTLYVLFAFIIPATVHQVLSIQHPANLMTDFIDVRDREQERYEQADSITLADLIELFPEIENSPVYQQNKNIEDAMSSSVAALSNELKKESIALIEKEKTGKNAFIENTFWFNPVTLFQNRFNAIARTHYNDYQNYRDEIQALIEKQIRTVVMDTWYEVKVDEEKFYEYLNLSVE